jgi:serine/threonine protein kinase
LIKLLAYVGTVPAMSSGYFASLLASCYFWRGTAGASLSVEDDQTIQLVQFLHLEFLSFGVFYNALEEFVNAIEHWHTKALGELLGQDPVLAADGRRRDVDQPNPDELDVSDRERDYSEMKELRVLREIESGTSVLTSSPDDLVLDRYDALWDLARFMTEIEALVRAQHPCVVELLGYSFPSPPFPAQIGRRFYARGTLRELMDARESKRRPDWCRSNQVAVIVIGLVLGMRFIHSRRIVHGNLRPENIFLDSDGHPRIGGFGHCAMGDNASPVDVERTTEASRYLAPEVRDGGKMTEAADVYSFTVIMYELIAKRPVFDRSVAFEEFEEMVKSGTRPEIPDKLNPTVKSLISSGWSPDPGCRSSFDEILTELATVQLRVVPKANWSPCQKYADSIQYRPASDGD